MCERNDCKGSGHLLSFTFLILVGACNIPSFQAHQAVIKEGKCSDFGGNSVSETGENTEWSHGTQSSGNCGRCNALNTLKSWLYTQVLKTKGARLIHIDVDVVFLRCNQCTNKFVELYISSSYPQGTPQELRNLFGGLKLVEQINMKAVDKLQTEHIEYTPKQGTAEISLVFLGMKSCLRIERITVSYFLCNKTFEKGVPLPETISPAKETLQVNSSCSGNSGNPDSKQVFGMCSSNGTWYVPFPCLCKEGFSLENTGCRECKEDTYKDVVGNEPCTPCPLNSIKVDGRATRCKCRENFYRFNGDNYTDVCHGIPSFVGALSILSKTDTAVKLNWQPAKNHGNMNDSVHYDVQCFKCNNKKICNDPCGSSTKFLPSQVNIYGLNVTIRNLEAETKYLFVVLSKNMNSNRIDKSHWTRATKEITTEECEGDSYKKIVGDGPCTPCPLNSIKDDGATRCKCKQDFHRFIGDNDTEACHAIPSAVRDLSIVSTTASTVKLKWQPPENSGNMNDSVLYDVQCFKCTGKENGTCEELCSSITKFFPSGLNISRSNVTISNLEPATKYKFVILSKNVNSDRINKNKWKRVEKTIKTQVSPVKQSKSITVLVLSLIFGVFLLILVCLFGLFLTRQRKKRKESGLTVAVRMEADEVTHSDSDYATVNSPSYGFPLNNCTSVLFCDINHAMECSWEFPKERLIYTKDLGSGNFGTVKKALALPFHSNKQHISVAVKLLKETANEKDREDFKTELDLMKKLERHPYVVQFFGCSTKSELWLMIMEYLPGGDLLGFLRKSRGLKDSYNTGELMPSSRLDERELLLFSWMVAEGMSFLASHEIVHRDLAARNILVGEDNICKLSDFGLAREGNYNRKSQARLPIKWMAPEDLFHGQSTTMSDVWSYGILLWEIFTIGSSPYPGYKAHEVASLLETGYRMASPRHCSEKLYSLMMSCWNEDPGGRPGFSTISNFFQEIFKDDVVYLNMAIYDEHEYMNFDAVPELFQDPSASEQSDNIS